MDQTASCLAIYPPFQLSSVHRTYFQRHRYTYPQVTFSTTDHISQASNHEPVKAYVNGSEVASFIALMDDARAARLKRNLHSTFSSNGVLVYEKHVDHTVSELVSHLRTAGPTADLAEWCNWFAFDTMARIAFSEDQGFMSHQEDIGGAMAFARSRFRHWMLYWTIPWLDALLYKNWWARNSKRRPSGLTSLAIRVIESRKEKGGLGTHHDLLDLYMTCAQSDPELYTPSTIIGLTITTIQAGSETTAFTTAICLYNLLTHPHVLAKLRKELGTIQPITPNGWPLPSMSVLRSLPYLEACVKESNRLRPTINIPSERVVPKGGATISGMFIPAGTIVGNNTAGLYTDPDIWGADVDTYRPERWLEASDNERMKMNKANLMFSAGKRMCLGLNISWMEMRKVIPALVMNFAVSDMLGRNYVDVC
jgi:cytochrome P450